MHVNVYAHTVKLPTYVPVYFSPLIAILYFDRRNSVTGLCKQISPLDLLTVSEIDLCSIYVRMSIINYNSWLKE